MIFRRQSHRSFFGSTVGSIENLRALYLAKLLILSTGACFELEIRKYLCTIINFPFFFEKGFSLLNSFANFSQIFWMGMEIVANCCKLLERVLKMHTSDESLALCCSKQLRGSLHPLLKASLQLNNIDVNGIEIEKTEKMNSH